MKYRNSEEPKPVTSWLRQEEVLIAPFLETTWKDIENMGGRIATHHDDLAFRYRVMFDNGWGAAITKSAYRLSFGGHDLFELVVLDGSETPCFDTDVTNDYIYNLCDEDVLSVLRIIKRLDEHGKITRLAN